MTDGLTALRVQTVTAILDEVDPEGLLKMGAPEGHYESEAKTLVARFESGKPITPEYVRDVWLCWFGSGKEMGSGVTRVWDMPMRPAFARVAELVNQRLEPAAP